MATPLQSRDELDSTALRANARRMIAAGVNGLFVLGTTGEAPGLGYRLRHGLVRVVCDEANGRVPVLVSITDTSIAESLAMARFAAGLGAAAVVLAPPYYYRTSQAELTSYFKRLIRELPLPVYLYNIPSHTQTAIAPETARALAELPAVLGIKDSSGDLASMESFVAIRQGRPDWEVFCGPEEILVEAVRLGANGGIAGGSNLWPRFYVELRDAAAAGNGERALAMQQIVNEISSRIYGQDSSPSSYLRGMKCALAKLTGCRYIMAEPYQPFTGETRERIEQAVDEIDLRIALNLGTRTGP